MDNVIESAKIIMKIGINRIWEDNSISEKEKKKTLKYKFRESNSNL